MCYQVTYTLPCEHVKTQVIYCAAATTVEPGQSNASGTKSGTGKSSSSKSKHKSSVGSKPSSRNHSNGNSKDRPSSSPSAPAVQKRPCANLSVQLLPYPMPPSYAADPTSFSGMSPLSPRCPLGGGCPFEQKNRCWNCCWCGKAQNMTGRCSGVSLYDGSQVRCVHICCQQCEATVPAGGWEEFGFV